MDGIASSLFFGGRCFLCLLLYVVFGCSTQHMRNMLSVPILIRVNEFCSYMVKPGCNAKDFPGSPVEAPLPM